MTVSVQQKRNKLYAVLNWTEYGKRKTKWIDTGTTKKREANIIAKDVLREWEAKITANPTDILFSDYLLRWIEDHKTQIANSTYSEYKRMLANTIAPYFAERKIELRELTQHDIMTFYRERMDAGVSPNTILHYQASIHAALKDAVMMEMVPKNVADFVKLPKKVKFHGDFYTQQETERLLNVARGTRLEIPIILAVTLGLRRGEICGLRWDTINLDEKYLTIKARMIDKGEGTKTQNLTYEPGAKSDAGVRTFPLSDNFVQYLKQLHTHQLEMRLLHGIEYNTEWNGYVCVDDYGDYIKPDYISRYFPELLQKHGLRKIRFHDLRHTNATLLLANGVLLQELQGWLGHERQSTTADYYAHFQSQVKQNMMDVIDQSVQIKNFSLANR